MSDSDAISFDVTPSSSDSLEGENERPLKQVGPSRRAPLAKRPSLQKRKKPAQIKRRAAKTADPFDDAALLKPSDTMDEEMKAMKQVFLRMSEKKVQQKQERKAECKRLYKEAFHAEVEQVFRKAAKNRSKMMDAVSTEIEDIKVQLDTSSKHLLDVHSSYKTSFAVELTAAKKEISELRSILADVDSQYGISQKKVEQEYAEVTEAMDISLQQLEVKLIETNGDKSYFSSFRPHIECLL